MSPFCRRREGPHLTWYCTALGDLYTGSQVDYQKNGLTRRPEKAYALLPVGPNIVFGLLGYIYIYISISPGGPRLQGITDKTTGRKPFRTGAILGHLDMLGPLPGHPA